VVSLVAGRIQRMRSAAHAFPQQFWVLVVGTFVYVGGAALGFPYEGIYMHRVLHASLSWIGLVFGGVPLLVSPLQIWGGQLTDTFGRRKMIILSVLMGVVWFVGFAFVRTIWQVAVLVAVESAFGWPLFQTACNAMIADVLSEERRAEGYSVNRVAMNVGVVLGPAAGGLALGWGASFRQLFLAAAAGCLLMVLMMVAWIRESRPESAVGAVHADERGRRGYRIVLADRRFLVFSAVAVLPVLCIGNFGSIYSVFITDFLHVRFGVWGWLLAFNALIVATVQYPLVRAVAARGVNRMALLGISSTLLAAWALGSVFAGPVWSLVILVAVISFGEVLLSPIASAVVSDMAPEAVRGRYMGVWTVVWNGGASLGPIIGGVAMDGIGGRPAFALIAVAGAAGALSFALLARGRRRRRLSPRRFEA
jgi:MFS family permease